MEEVKCDVTHKTQAANIVSRRRWTWRVACNQLCEQERCGMGLVDCQTDQ